MPTLSLEDPRAQGHLSRVSHRGADAAASDRIGERPDDPPVGGDVLRERVESRRLLLRLQMLTHGRYTVRAAEWRQGGKVTKTVYHELRVERFRNGRTGEAVIATSRYTTKLLRHGPFRLVGSLMQVRDEEDGTLLLSSAGSVTIDDIHDHYVFLKQPKHATLVPGFTEIPDLCEMLGGHRVPD